MIGLISPKKEYFYTGKWRSNEDRNETDFFKFKISKSHDTYKTDLGNMTGTEGNLTIETMSGIDFKVNDFMYWRGMRFNITKIEEDFKRDNEQAFSKFNFNGGLVKVLYLRKAGNE